MKLYGGGRLGTPCGRHAPARGAAGLRVCGRGPRSHATDGPLGLRREPADRPDPQPVVQARLHSAGDASPRAALLLPQIQAVFSVVAPGPRGAGVRIGRETVRRYRKAPVALPRQAPAYGRLHARGPNQVWLMDLTTVPRWLGLRSWQVLGILDAWSRLPVGAVVYRAEPHASQIAAALRRAVRAHGAPRVLVSDRGRVFRAAVLRRTTRRLRIQHRFGAVGQVGSIARLERRRSQVEESPCALGDRQPEPQKRPPIPTGAVHNPSIPTGIGPFGLRRPRAFSPSRCVRWSCAGLRRTPGRSVAPAVHAAWEAPVGPACRPSPTPSRPRTAGPGPANRALS